MVSFFVQLHFDAQINLPEYFFKVTLSLNLESILECTVLFYFGKFTTYSIGLKVAMRMRGFWCFCCLLLCLSFFFLSIRSRLLKRRGRGLALGGCATAGIALRVGNRRRGGRRGAREGRLGWDEPLLHPFLLLHASILEPDFHLRLIELKSSGDLNPPRPCQVFVEVELFLQFRQLLGGKIRPTRVVCPNAETTESTAKAI